MLNPLMSIAHVDTSSSPDIHHITSRDSNGISKLSLIQLILPYTIGSIRVSSEILNTAVVTL